MTMRSMMDDTPFLLAWRRASPRIVPFFAVITAFLMGIPFIILTGGKGEIGQGVAIAGEAYSALIEGSLGIAINDQLSKNDLSVAEEFLRVTRPSLIQAGAPFTYRNLRDVQRKIGRVVQVGEERSRRYLRVYDTYAPKFEAETGAALQGEALEELVFRLPAIARLTPEGILHLLPLLEGDQEYPGFGWLLDADLLSNREARDLIQSYVAYPSWIGELLDHSDRFADFTAEEFAAMASANLVDQSGTIWDALVEMGVEDPADWLEEFIHSAAADRQLSGMIPASALYEEAELLSALQIMDEEDVLSLRRVNRQRALAAAIGLVADSQDAADLQAVSEIGVQRVADFREALSWLDQSTVSNLTQLNEQLNLWERMYDEELLAQSDAAGEAVDILENFDQELDALLAESLVVRRPGSRVIVHHGVHRATGIITEEIKDRTDPNFGESRPHAFYLRLGGSALLFFPLQLEDMLVRSLPYIITGLAVALSFKAGMFNIGAEGQLYAAGIFAVFVGYSLPFTDLPAILHLPLMMIAGILGGALWAAIPGALKAYTGAHEVITTIMLNFVAIRMTDWLIKFRDPWLMGDPTASVPRTPYIAPSAEMPTLDQIAFYWILLAAVFVFWRGIHGKLQQLREEPRLLIRPFAYALMVLVGGLFLQWITVRGSLHLGLLLMVGAVWFTNAFLEQTTPGFELRSVGANPHGARYAGMSVKKNIVVAMALSGALAGLAGAIEISSVQRNLQPDYFLGLGFEAIAVALLAQTNPRNMIAAGLLWGGLWAGQDLVQARAGISRDLITVVKALIIMFVAADAIIRFLWRVPKPTLEEKEAALRTSGW
ncbi:MAG: ABC transporter permease [Anaerolineaceae bacterium]|nr:ABC transporter permease [Anaerolineaceae bacterium]